MIDLYQIHWPDPATPFSETMAVLSELKSFGAIREIGVCNLSPEQLETACSLGEIASYQGLYNYLQREAEDKILPLCREKKISFISYSSLAQGLLGGDFREGFITARSDVRRFNPLFADENAFSRSLSKVAALGKKPSHKALSFLAEKEDVTCMLVSMTKRKHLDENISVLY
jgi:aryl-alcohol dehydrogenase-like predicted oxidoreductase